MEVPVVWGRDEAVARLRKALLTLVDGEHSMCQVASEHGIFCRGFGRWNASEFDRRWRSAIGRSTHLSRAQMEEFANLWQLSEQYRQRVSLACDAASNAHGGCRGWDEFSNADLSRFCAEVLASSVQVVEVDSPDVLLQSKETIRLPLAATSRWTGEATVRASGSAGPRPRARAIGKASLEPGVVEVVCSRVQEL
jgi:hypothetical protein